MFIPTFVLFIIGLFIAPELLIVGGLLYLLVMFWPIALVLGVLALVCYTIAAIGAGIVSVFKDGWK